MIRSIAQTRFLELASMAPRSTDVTSLKWALTEQRMDRFSLPGLYARNVQSPTLTQETCQHGKAAAIKLLMKRIRFAEQSE